MKIGDKIHLINDDPINGESKDQGIIIEILSMLSVIVTLVSDPTIQCKVDAKNGKWYIIEDVETSKREIYVKVGDKTLVLDERQLSNICDSMAYCLELTGEPDHELGFTWEETAALSNALYKLEPINQ